MGEPRPTVSLVYRPEETIDAIDQYSRGMVAALRGVGVDASYVPDRMLRVLDSTWIVVQYQAFTYGRWGFAPWLISDVARVRARGTRVALMVHEAWVGISDWRSALMGGWQRTQLRALARLADCVMTSTEILAREFDGAVSMPIPANIAPVESTPGEARTRLGLGGKLTVALFGRDHWSRALDHAEDAVTEIAETLGPDQLTVLNLGADAPVPRVPPGVELHTPGRLGADELSLYLRASDLVLLAFIGGVSARRSTLSASLAHGLPVVGVHGPETDRFLTAGPDRLVLTPVGDRAAFARAAAGLAQDPDRRRAVGAEGRRLYEEHFDWPVLVRRFTSLLGLSARPVACLADAVVA